MSSASPTNAHNEPQDFLERYPDITSIDLLISDLNGVIRGKRIPRDNLSKVFKTGIFLPASVFALDINGNTVEETGLGLSSGDGDRLCRAIPGTLNPAPWLNKNHYGQLLMTMEEMDGTPFFADPRQILRRLLKQFSDRGLTPVVALELEFYLVDRLRDGGNLIQPPQSPCSGERATQSQLYSVLELDEYAEFINDLQSAAQAQDLPLDTVLKECAPGQFEANLVHDDDALRACDNTVLLKRLIKGVALRHGFEATFMAKPYGQEAGSGTHVHASIVDSNGQNIFAENGDDPLESKALQHAVGGLLGLMPDSMALLAPNLNSFRRFQEGLYVPMAPTWGYDNRSVAIRIPAGPKEARRIEHRVAGADVNPYLLLATVLASIHHGMDQQLTPAAPIIGNAYDQIAPQLTNSWTQALHLLGNNRVLGEQLGEDFIHVFIANRQSERAETMREVSAMEYDWYLRQV
ncbi:MULTISPECIES: glutamine synthetase family protein [unclassified Halomonas]|uniref:glutamine synthetase family protein n=1 Tax=unclassified Halomonas TaxID=2609666 RepID=UPI0006DA9826|nr:MULTISPECIES: glutamine synthetase family protein [unclassified Halomonas]KPQ21851.1 MAG: glutamine synthetase [Halomonas sp. HL-93]SBR45684.1 glutamate--putrescine ligase [Halomonas sp. HL-93]SNY98399.1 glutamate--putrescine ligase [Halomonas sp. hl-4]